MDQKTKSTPGSESRSYWPTADAFEDRHTEPGHSIPNILIKNVHLPHADRELEQQLFHVACIRGRVHSVTSTRVTEPPLVDFTDWKEVDGKQGLLIPSWVEICSPNYSPPHV